MRRWIPFAVLLGLAAVAAAAALAGVGGEPGAQAAAVASSGDFSISNSKDGLPVFGASGIGPGDSAQGTVEIAATGDVAARLTLAQHDLLDTPGLGGGLLSSQLQLRVEDVTGPGAPALVYAGPLATMPAQGAGRLDPGETRSFEFTATLPDTGTASDQNDLQGAATTVAYSWTASEAGVESGGGGPGAPNAPGGGGSAGSGEAITPNQLLDLTVSKIRRKLRGGRLVALTACDRSCRLTVSGRVRARGAGGQRAAKIRFAGNRLYAPGAQRLRIPVPRQLRRWLRETPGRERLRAKLRFVAVGADGERDAVRKTVRLRAGE